MKDSLFVARQPELHSLHQSLDRAIAGQGQVLLITGEAGQGKTALMRSFAHQAQAQHPQVVIASGNCNAYAGVGDPYLPFREILELLTGDETRGRLGTEALNADHQLCQVVPVVLQALVDHAPDLLHTLLPAQGVLNRALSLMPERQTVIDSLRAIAQASTIQGNTLQQKSLFDQYATVVQAVARHSPLVLLLDDLQWADVGSIHLLFHLGRCLKTYPILVVGALRPAEVAMGRQGDRHPLEPVMLEFQRDYGDIMLDLGQAEGRAFIDELLDSESNRLGLAFRETLYQQTDGHPLFTLELLRDMQERGELVRDEAGTWMEQARIDWTALPARVEGAIAQRMGRLARPLQALLQVASVEGEDFTAEVIARALQRDSHEVVRHLSQELDKTHRIVQSLGLRTEGGIRLSRYRFRHILMQRYLYNSLDEAERAYLNEAIGQAIEEIYGPRSDQFAVYLARYFQEAARPDKAIGYLIQAGKNASQLSAHVEAIAHFNQALDLLTSLPTPETLEQELDIRTLLGPVLMITEGQSSFRVGANYTRAWNLCQSMSNDPRQFPILWGLWRFQLNRAKLKLSQEFGEQLLALAEVSQDSALLLEAHMALGTSLLYRGQNAAAQTHLQQARHTYNHQAHAHLAFSYGGYDPAVYCLAYAPFYLWIQGYPDQAIRCSLEVIDFARALAHPYSLVFALYCVELFQYFRQDTTSLQQRTEESMTLCNEYQIPLFRTIATALQGWVRVRQQQDCTGIDSIREGLAAYEAVGSGLIKPIFLSLLADAYDVINKESTALDILAEALEIVQQTEERFWEAEIHRRIGEILLKSQTPHPVLQRSPEAWFLEAIAIAQRQRARMLELRATLNLFTLWRQQGKAAEAYTQLLSVYRQFTEGFDTPELKAAKALLDAHLQVSMPSPGSSFPHAPASVPILPIPDLSLVSGSPIKEISPSKTRAVASSSEIGMPKSGEPERMAIAHLTEREKEILELIAQGLSNTEIGTCLFISPKTVRNHISNIFSKMQVTTRAQVIVQARQAGFGRTDDG
jgi:predicted ATPase/DNA-binding CsgD family transcriptional regulator